MAITAAEKNNNNKKPLLTGVRNIIVEDVRLGTSRLARPLVVTSPRAHSVLRRSQICCSTRSFIDYA